MEFAVPLTRREAVLQQLRGEIVSGNLAPGTLVKDAEIAARLGVSITPVREAIGQLAAEGLIDVAPNRTRRVSEVTRRNALELVDVMQVLACAGFEWGVDLITETHLERMRLRLGDFERELGNGNVTAASGAGADVSTIMISAAGNRELQTHIDLVVARTLRVLALGADSDVWKVWLRGYRQVIAHLEAGERADAIAAHRQIYADQRALLEKLPLNGTTSS